MSTVTKNLIKYEGRKGRGYLAIAFSSVFEAQPVHQIMFYNIPPLHLPLSADLLLLRRPGV